MSMMILNEFNRIGLWSESRLSSSSSSSDHAGHSIIDVHNESPVNDERERDGSSHSDSPSTGNSHLDAISNTHEDQRSFPELPKCPIHRKACPFVCVKCKVHVCRACILSDHSKCPISLMDRFVVNEWYSTLKKDINDVELLKSKIVKAQENFQLKVDRIRTVITEITSRAIEDIEKQRKLILGRIEYVEKMKKDSWNCQARVCDSALQVLEQSLNTPEKLNIDSIVTLRSNLFKAMENCLTFTEDDYIEYVHDITPQFNLGYIKISVNPKRTKIVLPDNSYTNTFNCSLLYVRNHFDEEVKDGNYAIRVEMREMEENKTVYLILENLKNGTFKIWYYPTTEGNHALYVYLNDVPISGGPFEINVKHMKIDAKPFLFGEIDELDSKPWGICADYEGRIILSYRLKHCIRIFREDGTLVRKFGGEGSQPGKLKRPAGVAVDRKLRRIIVADKDNHRIQVFSYGGEYLLHFGKEGQKTGDFRYPWDVAVNDSSLIAVSDSHNFRIQLFDRDGTFVSKFDFREYDKQEIEMPRGVAFQIDGSLLVTDFNKHKIILIKNMDSYKMIGSKGSTPGKFYRPQGIDVDSKGRFLVVDSKNNRVQVSNQNNLLTNLRRFH